jgi:hypothetical protein
MCRTTISQQDCQYRKQTSSTAPDEYFNTRRKALFASPLDDCLTAKVKIAQQMLQAHIFYTNTVTTYVSKCRVTLIDL